ncbi:Cof-type HAD-IIB family hydrolase [Testudinibacter sp. TR-2022]|uniref:Cof-type HAD-IIB family hydrolase n=2 Tax=Testudinibacter sp. TR-2022 TaxID=2585029 RepID=UPI0011182E5A|nr:Cof-type HAD-IIB family hydrolase [Testudinibacter sp. TR-2022]TNH05162.1 Cof-type HAD-IIB family hydrolase [Pasteurellaceae bacterium Phil31]TNH05873.1 Cof-type HAD-IIB family hydrolase [Testudinibacter sp. TR-2022]TNH11146.1 Cof-type HAD-IIB family hydrolase [Testudinibacter sp. TR-2022]TNH12828.1 Cof-type HAD-IIB family hydrolase [Testudinibacter sp. TR-2022]
MSFNRPFRAVVSDLDGTLLTSQHIVGNYSAETLKRLEDQGIDIVLASGRNHIDVAHILNKIKSERAAMITSNGARIHDLHGNLLYSNSLPEQIAFELMNLEIDHNNVILNSYQDDGWFINVDLKQLRKYHKDSGFDYNVVDFSRHHGRGTEKVFFVGRTAADLATVEQQIRQRYADQVSITYSTPQCLEVMNQGVTKANALAHLLQDRQYALSDCIAFGDGMNDIEMLTEVGRGCVMGNADPRVKAALPHLQQIGLNRDESVATYLRALFNLV